MPFPICDTEKEKQFKKVCVLACKRHFQSTPITGKVAQDSHEFYSRNSTQLPKLEVNCLTSVESILKTPPPFYTR